MDVRSPGRWICPSMAGARDYSNRHGFCDLGTLALAVQLEWCRYTQGRLRTDSFRPVPRRRSSHL